MTDCKIHFFEPNKRDKWEMRGDEEVLKSSYKTHYDYTSFSYVLLCEFAGAYITTSYPSEGVGFDPNFEIKYHYPKYGTNDFYLVK